MKLYDLLCSMEYNQHINIYSDNEYGQCLFVFRGTVLDARKDEEETFWHLEDEIEIMKILANAKCEVTLLVFVKYNGRAEKLYSESQIERFKQTGSYPWKSRFNVEREVEEFDK